jgi:hypothetical protein
MVVSAKLVASTGDAGVEETGLSGVVVAELGRAAVTPWVAFHVSGLWIAGLWTCCERCARDGFEVAAWVGCGVSSVAERWCVGSIGWS